MSIPTRQSLALIEAGARKEEIEMAEAALAATRARFETAKNRLGYAEVRAPISGRVLKKFRETGDYVSPDVPFVQGYDTVAVGSPVVSVAARERQEVSADINETDLSKVSIHQPVEIIPNAYPSETFRGSVTQISPHADKNKNTIEVKATFEQSTKTLPYDMSVKLRFVRSASRPARRVPTLSAEAVLRKDGKHFVFLVVDSRVRIDLQLVVTRISEADLHPFLSVIAFARSVNHDFTAAVCFENGIGESDVV